MREKDFQKKKPKAACEFILLVFLTNLRALCHWAVLCVPAPNYIMAHIIDLLLSQPSNDQRRAAVI